MASLPSSPFTSIPPTLSLTHISAPSSPPCFSPPSRRRCLARRRIVVSAGNGGDLLGDFGARDPFPAEIATNFCEKVGNFDTEHRTLIPNISALSLAHRTCEPVSPSQAPLSINDAKKLLRKVVGWRLVEGDGGMKLECLWKVREQACGLELIDRINRVIQAEEHRPDLRLQEPNQVRAELWTASIGGLSLNDFIVAAKIDEIKTADLLPKKRAWA